MKTIYAECVSSKEISLSKAAKILSKFVSADNGASPALNAYLRRSSAAFNELNQLHKELKKKKKTNQELSNGRVKSKNVVVDDDEKSTLTGVKLSQEQLHGSVNESGSEKHQKKSKFKKEEIAGDSRVEFGEKEQNYIQSDHNNSGMEDKKEKKKNNKHNGQEQQKETENKLSNNVVNGENGGVLKMEQRKKRKFEDVEDKSGDLTDKRIKRKH